MSYELVYASKFPEFFYKADNSLVSEHTPVGVDITTQDNGSLENLLPLKYTLNCLTIYTGTHI